MGLMGTMMEWVAKVVEGAFQHSREDYSLKAQESAELRKSAMLYCLHGRGRNSRVAFRRLFFLSVCMVCIAGV
jgi:hypothetical protein